ncbi:DUF4097 family beta strand repeat-containing protein [Paenibacillus sp. CAU 1782]
MTKLGVQGWKRSLLTAVLAFLVPGLGHLFNGLYARGFLLMAGLLLDYVAIFRLADEDGGRHLLLIVYLCLLLPVFYFISVYDSLQRKENEKKEPEALRPVHGLLLATTGVVMMALLKPPSLLQPWLNELAEFAVGPLLLLLACFLALRAKRREGDGIVYKLGRVTAAVLILTVGFLLLWDLLRDRNDIALLKDWWPLLFVLLGIEMALCSFAFRQRFNRRRLDAKGISAALVVAVTAFSVTQYADFPVRWLDQFNVDLSGVMSYSDEQGFQYERNVIKVPLDPDVSSISVQNPNGDVKVRTSFKATEIEIYSTIWVDTEQQEEADTIASRSSVSITPGKEVVVEGKGQAYGTSGNRLPRINLEIVLPVIKAAEDSESDLFPGSGKEPELAPGDVMREGELPEQELEQEQSAGSQSEASEGMDGDSAVIGDPTAIGGPDSAGDVPSTDTGSQIASVADPETAESAESAEVPGTSNETPTVGEEGEALPDPLEGSVEGDEPLPTEAARMVPKVSLAIDISNGGADIAGLEMLGGTRISTGSGMVSVADMTGPVSVKVSDGGIQASGIDGETMLEIKNGVIEGQDIKGGALYAATTNGNVLLSTIRSDLVAETKNGAIEIRNAEAGIKADTLNGSITIDSGFVGGNWDLDSSVGEISLTLPGTGDYSLYGSVTFGKISTELPFEQIRKTVRGTIGDGTFRIHINATNSISIRERQ